MKTKRSAFVLVLLTLLSTEISIGQNIDQTGKEVTPILTSFNKTKLGENVYVFEQSMNMAEIQSVIDTIFNRQDARGSEFSRNRYALLFQPGNYKLDIRVGYYMSVIGLGESPEDVVINGAVRSTTTHDNSVLTNFWRSVENLTIIPANSDTTVIWGVSQASPMRRVHIKGNLRLFDKGYASGGFLADSKVDGVVTSGPQQQWLSRNTVWKNWSGGNWNMMFIGVPQAPEGDWPAKPYTVIKETPLIREKPYLAASGKSFLLKIPGLKLKTTGPSWTSGSNETNTVPLNDFYIAWSSKDNSESLNNALNAGKNILFTPGIYKLEKSLVVRRKGTIIFGMGMPSLMPVKGTAAIETSDSEGITIAGLTIDAGPMLSPVLFRIGEPGSLKIHNSNPSFFYDIFFRVGGPSEGSAKICMEINSNNVCIDHIWLWRADHGNGVGWAKNKCANGLVVNGNDVLIYGLFNEHFQEYQTLWNGERGKVFFYQSEMPYDPPTVESWMHDGVYGYASYKVSDNVKDHEAWGIGIYNVFYDAPIIVDNAIETPQAIEYKMHHLVIFWLNGNKESIVKSIINGKGGPVNANNKKAVL